MINSCNTCQHFQARQYDLPIEKQPTPNHPWQIMASDLFDFDGGQYMVMPDMYSKMCFVQKVPSAGATSAAVIRKMKEIFAKHGVSDILRSDNGPQYACTAFAEFVEEWGISTHYIKYSLPNFKWICRINGQDHQDSFHKS